MDDLKSRVEGLEREVTALTERVAFLSLHVDQLVNDTEVRVRQRPVKKSKPNVCALDPERDSETCPNATVYRYQQGCRGVACVRSYRLYYKDYRNKEADSPPPNGDPSEDQP